MTAASTQSCSLQLIIPYCQIWLWFHAFVLDHPSIFSDILSLHFQSRLWLLRLNHEVVVAVRAVLVAVLELVHILTKALFALFARKDHFHGLLQVVVLCLGMALGAVEPLLAAGRADGHLCVEDVFAEGVST